jgi:HAD superfamily hydrolase (TIGR01549 family)
MGKRRIEAVTFDVGGTLLADPKGDERRAEGRALKYWLREHGVEEKADRRRILAAASRSWSDSGLAGEEAAAKAADTIVDVLGVRVGESKRHALRTLLADIYDDGPYHAAPGIRPALERLARRGVKLGIVSNRGARPGRLMMRHLEARGLTEFFDPAAVVWSDEIGISKPDPRIFLCCLRALDVHPRRAAHVGDVRAKDVAGARELGMLTVRYTGVREDPKDGPEADVVLGHYEELEQALGLPSRTRTARRLITTLPFVLGPAAYESIEAGTDVVERLAQLYAAIPSLW